MGDLDFGPPFRRPATQQPGPVGWVYMLLALLVGVTGIHNAYAGRRRVAAAQCCLFILWIGWHLLAVRLPEPLEHLSPGGWLVLWTFYDLCCVTRDGQGRRMR